MKATLDELQNAAEAATRGERFWTPSNTEGGMTLAVPGHVSKLQLREIDPVTVIQAHDLNILKTTDDWAPNDADARLLALLDAETVLRLVTVARLAFAYRDAIDGGWKDKGSIDEWLALSDFHQGALFGALEAARDNGL